MDRKSVNPDPFATAVTAPVSDTVKDELEQPASRQEAVKIMIVRFIGQSISSIWLLLPHIPVGTRHPDTRNLL